MRASTLGEKGYGGGPVKDFAIIGNCWNGQKFRKRGIKEVLETNFKHVIK